MPENTNTKTQNDKYAPTAWGNSAGVAGNLHDLDCPSGQTCQVRRPGIEGLIREGLLRDLDTLTSMVGIKIEKKKNPRKAQLAQQKFDPTVLMEDPEKLTNVMHIVDRVVCATVVQPKVKMTPNDVTSRKDDVIYTDMIDLEDRMYIFSFVMGGSADVATFRAESKRLVGVVDDEHDVEGSA